MWKMLHFQSPLASNHVGEKKPKNQTSTIWIFFSLKIFFRGLQESRDPGGWTNYQETPSGFSFVMIKNWQGIFKTPDKIIDYFF